MRDKEIEKDSTKKGMEVGVGLACSGGSGFGRKWRCAGAGARWRGGRGPPGGGLASGTKSPQELPTGAESPFCAPDAVQSAEGPQLTSFFAVPLRD